MRDRQRWDAQCEGCDSHIRIITDCDDDRALEWSSKCPYCDNGNEVMFTSAGVLLEATIHFRVDGADEVETPTKYHVEPDADGAGDWHVVTFSTGRRVQILTQHPLVIVDPEVH